MKVSENKNFVEVSTYKNLTIEDVLNSFQTTHLSSERLERFNLAERLNRTYIGKGKEKEVIQSDVDKVFLVDKGHKDGKELHCVTKKGIIFILNEEKYKNNDNALITALIGRPNQVARLYEDCNLKAPENILDRCRSYQAQGLNEK